mmetsp:Transcript_29128/g.32696  ORF Transcript_29128/g.32696 Transcript_29128/m.32696 type:complete len:325 (+) Transcript_29128:62-1036(+)|eukprot:CAMPEP_0170838588 /NCGR_PEP_ID=MMETSP0734-20130129/3502_1 /TAXON_ID=186038 /ORGANISM="Fragilariopsis kerguelensis, Strain L26-C5" /LENGTH=324 /DNA_ID=CAMNT_0011206095 /DNA_START=59 /DNA_END=1033 /DNA_ORIENTATION=+
MSSTTTNNNKKRDGSQSQLLQYINATKEVYGSYVTKGGDGEGVLKLRGKTLGYDDSFLQRCNIILTMTATATATTTKQMKQQNQDDYIVPSIDESESKSKAKQQQNNDHNDNTSNIEKLFMYFCGSGCPLRIGNDKYSPNKGDVVVDLGCGAGHDTILASGLVGPTGQVFGIDFTQAMLDQAQQNVDTFIIANKTISDGDDDNNNKNNNKNDDTVEGKKERGIHNSFFSPIIFCLGGIDDPSAELFAPFDQQQQQQSSGGLKKGIADVVISNGVFNLCSNKSVAFRTAFELLRPGGRFLFNDLCIVENKDPTAANISCTFCATT